MNLLAALIAAPVVAAALTAMTWPSTYAGLPPDLARAAKAYDLAQVNCDRAELERLLADDFVLMSSDGTVQDKAAFIADSTAPGLTVEPFVIVEPVARVWSDGAVLGGWAELKGALNGKPFAAPLRFSDVWAKRDGRWQVVLAHATRAPRP